MGNRKINYTATINYEALKSAEGIIFGNFSELVYKVIRIDGKPYTEWAYIDDEDGNAKPLKITTGRKTEFLSLIEKYAIVEFIGIKCHVLTVLDEKDIEEVRKAKIQRHIDKI